MGEFATIYYKLFISRPLKIVFSVAFVLACLVGACVPSAPDKRFA